MRRIKYLFEWFQIKNCGIWYKRRILHVYRIEFVSAGNTAMGIIKLIFSRWQVYNEDNEVGMAKEEDGEHDVDTSVLKISYSKEM